MGEIRRFQLAMKGFSQSPRTVWAFLPDSYVTSRKKYDVLYMFDGHNLFDDGTATYGKSWGMKEYLDETKADLVVIGVDCNHTGDRRLSEYCPFPPEETYLEDLPTIRPHGKQTAAWFAEVLKPYCEKTFRIHKERTHVGIGGSSMGGLMSEYMISAYNDLFSKAACVSPSTHFNLQDLLKQIDETSYKQTQIYIDQGSQEVHGKRRFIDAVDIMLTINHAWTMKGIQTYPHLTPGGHHSEADWERVLPVFLPYLYPKAFHMEKDCR